jgi:hypothetical protein
MSRCARFAAAVLVVFALSVAFAQTPTSTAPVAQRDPAALAAVQNAVNAMGGSAIAGLRDCTAQATVQPAPDVHSSPYAITYKNSGDQFRIESVRDNQLVVLATDTTHYQRQNADGKLKLLPAHMLPSEFPKHLVALVLYRELQNSAYSVQYGGTGTVSGRKVVFVTTQLEGDKDWAPLTSQVWSFDAVTGLPVRVDWVIPMVHNMDNTVSGYAEFADFRSVSGVLIPFQITSYVDGSKLTVQTITSVSVNAGISPAEFRLGGVQ